MGPTTKAAYAEAYRLGLYAGCKLGRLGFDVKEPEETKDAQE